MLYVVFLFTLLILKLAIHVVDTEGIDCNVY